MSVHAVARIRLRGHSRKFGRFAFLRGQHLEVRHGPNSGAVSLSGGLCGQRDVVPGMRGVSVRPESALSQQDKAIARKPRNPRCTYHN